MVCYRYVAQWGYTGDQSNKITFPLRYSKAVWGIMVTTSVGIPQSPVDVTLSGATEDGYNDTGYKTYWLAYGVQQWGVATQNGYATSFPITFPARCLAVVATYVLQIDSTYWQYPLSAQNTSRTSFTVATKSNWGATDTAHWIAVGM